MSLRTPLGYPRDFTVGLSDCSPVETVGQYRRPLAVNDRAVQIGTDILQHPLEDIGVISASHHFEVLLVKRFDRGTNGERIHIEDFAQVFGINPSRKYEGAAYHDISAALNVAVSSAAALEFVRRLALAALTGNGDMHLKNWSLIYRGVGDKPDLAPVYDVLSTIPYIPADAMALSLASERPFKALNAQRWKAFAYRARLPEAAVLRAVVDTVERVNDRWWSLPEREVVPAKVLERMDAHIRMMTPILSTFAN